MIGNVEVFSNEISNLSDILCDQNEKMGKRIRALFKLKHIGGSQALIAMNKAMSDSSVLLSHEVAYCMGQMSTQCAIPYLKNALQNEELNLITRHEAAEALGAIGDEKTISFLELYKNSPILVLSQTCQVSIDFLNWKKKYPNFQPNDTFYSFDPAPPSKSNHIAHLRDRLLKQDDSIFKRYKALFKLRNINTTESTMIICSALGTGGPLFDHEIAFVLGQIGSSLSVPFLYKALKNEFFHEMVRHEAAEALGAIPDENIETLLKQHLNDKSRIVRESCQVALDVCDYYKSDCLQYVDPISSAGINS